MDQPPIDYRRIQERIQSQKPEVPGDNFIESVAKMSLVLGGAYLGLKHFPRQQIYKMMDEAERLIQKYPNIEKFLPQLKNASSISPLMRKTGEAAATVQGYKDLHLAEDLAFLVRELAGKTGMDTNRGILIRGLISQYTRFTPPSHDIRFLTLGDVLSNTSLAAAVDKHVQLQEFIGEVKSNWETLNKLPGFRSILREMNITDKQLANKLALGPGLLAQKDTFYNVARFTPANMLDWITSPRITVPFIGTFRPLRLLNFSETMRKGPAFANLSATYAKGLYKGKEKVSSVLFSGGYLIPRHGARLGEPIADSWKLARTEMPIGIGAMMGAGVLPQAKSHIDYFLNQGYIDEAAHKTLKSYVDKGRTIGYEDVIKATKMELSSVDRLKIKLALLGEKLGIGPQFSESRSAIGSAWEHLVAKSRGTPEITEVFRTGDATPLWGGGPVTAFVNRKWDRLRLGGSVVDHPQNIKDLTLWERMQLKLGMRPQRWTSVPTREGREVARKATVAEYMKDGQPLFRSHPVNVSPRYAAYTGTGWSAFFNYHLNRPFWLLEEMTGMGVRPGKTPVHSAAKIVGLAGAAYTGLQLAEYVDYKLHRLGFDGGPITTPLKAYTGFRTLAQQAIDVTPVQHLSEYLEEKYPGLIESPLSKTLRAGATLFGTMSWIRGPGGVALGTALGLMHMTDLTMDYEKLRDIYRGEEMVAVKKGRWWMLGRQPFEGDKVQYYRPHLLASYLSKYKDMELYGSRQAKWAQGSWLPTPENWFGIKRLADPYYLERAHYNRRPYPVTSPEFQDLPLVGPLVSATLGRVIKPTKYMHTDMLDASGTAPWTPTLDDSPLPPGTGAALGMEGYPIKPVEPILKQRMDVLTGETVYQLFQWSGLPGFMLSFLKESATGSQYFGNTRPQLAASGQMASIVRDYYDMELGGGLGHTEFIRRLIPKERRITSINPLPNTMPSWIPGSRSSFESDRDNYINFHTGDAYTKIPMGEARLPGKGYETLHRMHSGVPGVYDAMDRLLVLSNIAPTSEAYEHYKTIVEGWAQGGYLDQYWEKRYYDSLHQVKTQLDTPFSERRFTAYREKKQITVAEVLSPTRIKAVDNMIYDIDGTMPDMNEAIHFGRRKGLSTDSVVRDYRNTYEALLGTIGKSVQIESLGRGFDEATPIYMEGISEKAARSSMWYDHPNSALAARAMYGDSMTGKMWEHLTHLKLPGPLNWPLGKFFSKYDALEEYQARELEQADFAGWDSPYQNFLKPWARQVRNFVVGEPYVPMEVRMERETHRYFDNLAYLKNRALEERAMAQGHRDAARAFKRNWTGTMAGIQIGGANTVNTTYRAVPRPERPYFKEFAKAVDPAERAFILATSPNYMQPVYERAWGNDPIQPHLFMGPTSLRNAVREKSIADPAPFIDRLVLNEVMEQGMPSADWMGWHPDVSLDAIKVKSIARAGMDIHKYSMWRSELEAADLTYPAIEPVPLPEPRFELEDELKKEAIIYNSALAPQGINRVYINRRKEKKNRRNFTRDYSSYMRGNIF